MNSSAPSSSAGPTAAAAGRNAFEGFKTRRVYALLNKSRIINKLALHPAAAALNDRFLAAGWPANALHSISIQAGEPAAQTLHHDDGVVRQPRPHKPFGSVRSTSLLLFAFFFDVLQQAIVVALVPCTCNNGATVVVPGSRAWGSQLVLVRGQAVPVIVPQGSLVYFLGALWHGGGQNRSSAEWRVLMV